MTITTERLAAAIFSNYILPARERGEMTITISASRVRETLDGAFPLSQIRGVLGSMKFRNTYHLALLLSDDSTACPVDKYVFKVYPSVPRLARVEEPPALKDPVMPRHASRAR